MKKSLLWVVVLLLSISMIAAFSLYGCKEEEVAAEEEATEEEATEEEEEATEEEATDEEFVLGWISGILFVLFISVCILGMPSDEFIW